MKDLKEFINEAVNKWDNLFKKYFGNDYKNHLKTKTAVFDGTDEDDLDTWVNKLENDGWLTIDIGGDTDTSIMVAVLPKSSSDKEYAEKAIKSLEEADEDELFDML